jgi:hypothetical protein
MNFSVDGRGRQECLPHFFLFSLYLAVKRRERAKRFALAAGHDGRVSGVKDK